MFRTFGQPRGERGVALVMALLVLLVMSLLAAVIMMSVNVERKIAGHDLRRSQALNTAEAGVSEVLSRLRNGDITLSTANPRAVAQIFLCNPGSVPVLGPDSTGVETKQPAGQWLNYSSATRGPDALTVKFKTDAARTVIYRYDNTLNPPVNTATGLPIYQILATGRQGRAIRRVASDVIQKPFNTAIKSALCANVDIKYVGNGVVCGYNHRGDTPPPSGENGRGGANSCVPYETASGHLPGGWTTGNVTNGGGAYQAGVPLPNATTQTGFYDGPWQAMGLPQADFYSWVGAPRTTEPASPNGIIYLDDDNIAQNQSGSFAYHGASGEGLLYVDGDLTLNSSFVYKGLVYVEGDLKVNGQAWILGGLIVRGVSEVRANGGSTILFSNEAIQLALAKYGGQFVTLSWREQ